jgi:hypothetical protein
MSFSAPAPAPDHQIVVVASSRIAAHAQVIDAADKVCAAARKNDPFGDFGTQDECIENTLSGTRVTHAAYSRTAQVSSR